MGSLARDPSWNFTVIPTCISPWFPLAWHTKHGIKHRWPFSSSSQLCPRDKMTGKQIKPGKIPEDLQDPWALAGWLGRWGVCSPGCCSPAHREGTLVPNRPHQARPRSGWSCSSSARSGFGLGPVEQSRSSWWDFLNSESPERNLLKRISQKVLSKAKDKTYKQQNYPCARSNYRNFSLRATAWKAHK